MTQSVSPRPRPRPSDLELPQLTSLLRRAALPVLGVTAAAGIGAYVLTSLQPKVYEASSTLFTEQSGGGNSALEDSILRPSPLPRGALEQALHSPVVVGLVVDRLRAAKVTPQTVTQIERDLRNELTTGGFSKLSVQANGDSQNGVFTLRARANTPALARDLANAGVAALQLWDVQRAQRRLEQARVALKMQLDVLDNAAQAGGLSTDAANTLARAGLVRDLSLIGASRRSVAGTLDVIAEAVKPAGPVAPRPKRSAILAALLTLLFAGGGAVLLFSRPRAAADWDSVPDETPLPTPRGTTPAPQMNTGTPSPKTPQR